MRITKINKLKQYYDLVSLILFVIIGFVVIAIVMLLITLLLRYTITYIALWWNSPFDPRYLKWDLTYDDGHSDPIIMMF